MGNYSKDPQTVLQEALIKGYSRVLFQQGSPVLDRELNLASDLASPQRLAEHYLGNGAPADSANAFRVSNLDVANNNFTIEAGRCLVGGGEVRLTANTTFKAQPHPPNPAVLPAGASNVYLRVFRSEVTGAQDSDLLNGGDVKAETAIREKLDWQVLVSAAAITTSDHFLLAVIDTGANKVTDQRLTGLTVAAIRNEINLARGSAASLDARLAASLASDGTLKAGAAGNQQLADKAVTQQKVADNSIAITQLKKSAISAPIFSVGPLAETDFILTNSILGKQHGHLLLSALVVGTSQGPNATASISYSAFYQQVNVANIVSSRRGITIKNKSNLTVSVAVQFFELLAS
ncbi:MAG TPA: hypothetical protein VJ464_12070 [Blastocatellia bacterium]|nr:hypothetical protein [Blastocatellia bacterium]